MYKYLFYAIEKFIHHIKKFFLKTTCLFESIMYYVLKVYVPAGA